MHPGILPGLPPERGLSSETGNRANHHLTPAAIRRGLWALQACTFLTWGGFFVVIPLIAVNYVDRLGWAAGSIGIVLGTRQFTQQTSSTFSGALADRFGAKGLICIGLLIRAIGFGMMAWADTFPLLLMSAVVSAVGGGLFESPRNAAVAAMTDHSNRRRYYSMTGVIAGLGTAVGTQAGALLIGFDFATVALGGATLFFVAFVLMIVFLPSVQVATERHGFFEGIAFALKDRVFVRYALFLMGYWFITTQFNISLVLRATEVAGSESAVPWIYGIQSGLTILIGYPFPRLIERKFAAFPMLIAGVALVATGMGLVAVSTTVPLLLGSVVVISLGQILTRPGEQTVSAGLASPAARGSYFGVAALSLAIGGSLGNFTGGLIYDYGDSTGHPEIPWIVFMIVGLLTCAGLWRIRASVTEASREVAAKEQAARDAEIAASESAGMSPKVATSRT